MFFWILIGYAGVLPILFLLLACGDRPVFEGTWLESLHRFLFGGGCCEVSERVIGCLFGEKGSNAFGTVETYCCDQPNPVLQLFYLAIVGGSYYSAASTSLQYIPGHYLGYWHKYIGHGGVIFGVVLFLMTSFCDPGTITAATLQQHSSAFPYDGILYEEKDCATCKIRRPARSKHCSICNRCIARFDHHCGWMNNCIGENNIRYFLSFLIWHVCLCWYGVYLLVAILLGEMKRRRVLKVVKMYYGSSRREIYPHILKWLLTFYSTQVLLIIFLVVISLLLASFASYHVYLMVTNTTTNEKYKWDKYERWQVELAWSKMVAEESRESSVEKSDRGKSSRRCSLLSFFRRDHVTLPPKPKQSSFRQSNIYDRGVIVNMAEIFFPLSHRTKVSKPNNTKKD